MSLDTETAMRMIPLSLITDELSNNVRTEYDEDSIKELAQSIESNGLISPLTIRPDFNLVAGHRRWRAMQLLVKQKKLDAELPVPCFIHDGTDDEIVVTMLVENLQREDISAIDEARGYMRLTVDHGYKTKQLAAAVGRSQAHILTRIKLLSLPDDMQACVGKNVSLDTAMSIARLNDAEVRTKLAKAAVNDKLNAWDIQSALRKQDTADQAKQIMAWAKKSLIEVFPSRRESPADEPWNGWTNAASFKIADLGLYVPAANDVVCLRYDCTGIDVFKPKAIEDTPAERTPLDEFNDRYDAYEDAVATYKATVGRTGVNLCLTMTMKNLQSIAMEQIAWLAVKQPYLMTQGFSRLKNFMDLPEVDNDDDGEEKPADPLTTFIGASTENAQRAWSAFIYTMFSGASSTLTTVVTQALDDLGVVNPGEFTEPEPWQDDDGTWRTDDPDAEVEEEDAD